MRFSSTTEVTDDDLEHGLADANAPTGSWSADPALDAALDAVTKARRQGDKAGEHAAMLELRRIEALMGIA